MWFSAVWHICSVKTWPWSTPKTFSGNPNHQAICSHSVTFLDITPFFFFFFSSAWIYLSWAFPRNENLEKCDSWCLPSLAEWFKSQPRCSMCWLFFYCPHGVGCTTFCSSHHKVDVWTLLTFGTPWITLLQLPSYKCLWEVLLSFLRSVYLEIDLLAHMVMLCLTFWAIANILRILFRNPPWCPISKHDLHPTVEPRVIFWRQRWLFCTGMRKIKRVRGPRKPHSSFTGTVS